MGLIRGSDQPVAVARRVTDLAHHAQPVRRVLLAQLIQAVTSRVVELTEIDRLNKTTYRILGLELKKVKYVRGMSFLQGTTVNFIRSVMIVILLLLIFDNELTPGMYFTFLFYSFFLFTPLQELGNLIITYREAEVSLLNFDRILKLLHLAGQLNVHGLLVVEDVEVAQKRNLLLNRLIHVVLVLKAHDLPENDQCCLLIRLNPATHFTGLLEGHPDR